ncbi:unnamed protein product [Lymnaea stagnalis]|uniref:Uncharacterized protein n=1 Tax=Lymnaea stagnalis TaxID=6523 RepID=A0AAV2IMZ1_LYMST
MWCCLSGRKNPEPDNQMIVDLKEVLRNNAWNSYVKELTKFQQFGLKRDNFEIDVPENYYVFQHVSTVVGVDADDKEEQEVIGDSKEGASIPQQNKAMIISGTKTSPDKVSLETFFGNDTPDRQTYKFRIEKSRKTVISVSFQKGFTFGGKANFSIGLTKDTSLGIEADMHFQVTKTDCETFEETILTEATSDIVVAPHSHCTASVCLLEKPFYKNFKVTTRMSMPQGEAPVYIRRKSDGKRVMLSTITNLTREFNKKNVPCVEEVIDKHGQKSKTKVDFVTCGVLQGTLVCNHKILLKSGKSVT